jgi:hypothetical protein
VKNASAVDNWEIIDTSRDTYNVTQNYLQPNSSAAEAATPFYDMNSNGFKIRSTGSFVNSSGASYIYMAFAENPFKYANAR